MINRGLLIFLYVIISVSYAFSQSGDTDILSLVEQYKTGADSTQTRPQLTGALDFLLSATAEDTLRKPAVAVREVRIVERLEPLAIIAEAYDSHDYYTSGGWTRDDEYVYPDPIDSPVSDVPFYCSKGVKITSYFGYRPEFGRMHYGVDIAMCVGDSIRVPMEGTLEYSGYDRRGYGHYLIVKHPNGLETRYAHLSKKLVTEQGTRLAAGEVIALSGRSGNSTGPHLHLEARYKGIPLNPLNVFRMEIIP